MMINKIRTRLGADFKDLNFQEMVKGGAATFLIRVAGLVVGYAFVFLVSRYYGSEVLGAHTLSVTVLMMFTVLGRLGLDTYLVRSFAQDNDAGRWDRILEVYLNTFKIIVPLGLLLSIVMYFSAGFISEVIFEKPMLTPYFKVISFGVLPMILRFTNSECYRGFRMHKQYAYSQNVSYFLYATVILGVLTSFSENNLFPNIAFVVSLSLLALSSSYLLIRRIRKHTNTVSTEMPVKDLVRNSVPMMMTSSMMLISGWINTIMLGMYSTESDVGIYSVVLKIATLSSFVLMSINSVATPRFAQFYAKHDLEGLKKYTNQTAKVIFYSSVPIFLLIIIFNKWLLGLFGEEFIVGSMALLITMGGQLFNVFAGSVGAILNMTGHQKVFRNIIFTSTFINIAACVILIPIFGLIGSALAGMVFMASWNLASMIYIKRKLKLNTYYNPF